MSECYKLPAGVESVSRYSRRAALEDSLSGVKDPLIQPLTLSQPPHISVLLGYCAGMTM